MLLKLRKWANRNDGRFFRIDNEPVGILAAIGTLALVGALILWQFQAGIGSAWAATIAVTGMLLLFMGCIPGNHGDDT